MIRTMLVFITFLTAAVATTVTAQEDHGTQATAQTGKLVIYRDNSKVGASFNVFADGTDLGRLKKGRTLANDLPAGTYKLFTNVRGSEQLTVVVKAGETVYVDGDLVKTKTGKYRTVMQLVTETVALESAPAVNDVI